MHQKEIDARNKAIASHMNCTPRSGGGMGLNWSTPWGQMYKLHFHDLEHWLKDAFSQAIEELVINKGNRYIYNSLWMHTLNELWYLDTHPRWKLFEALSNFYYAVTCSLGQAVLASPSVAAKCFEEEVFNPRKTVCLKVPVGLGKTGTPWRPGNPPWWNDMINKGIQAAQDMIINRATGSSAYTPFTDYLIERIHKQMDAEREEYLRSTHMYPAAFDITPKLKLKAINQTNMNTQEKIKCLQEALDSSKQTQAAIEKQIAELQKPKDWKEELGPRENSFPAFDPDRGIWKSFSSNLLSTRGNTAPSWNCFKHHNALLVAKKIQLMIEMHKFAELRNAGWVPDWTGDGNSQWGIQPTTNGLSVTPRSVLNLFLFGISFRDKIHAEEALQIFGDRIKEVYNTQF